MATVLGNNFTMYTGDEMNVIGCEDTCTVTITSEEIITTTKGSGRGTNREYGRYDATLQASGVMFISASEADAATAGKTDPTYLQSYLIQGKKVCAKYQVTDGTVTKYVIANWIIRSCTLTGQAGQFATYNIELALDGQLYESTPGGTDYDGPNLFIYKATSTVDGFTESSLVGFSRLYFVVKNKTLQTNVTITTIAGTPIDSTAVSVGTTNGGVFFGTPLVAGDIVIVSYDPAD